MSKYLYIFILIPFLGFFFNLFVASKNEKLITRISFLTTSFQFAVTLLFSIYWLIFERKTVYFKKWQLYSSDNFEFFFDFCFDEVTVVYLLTGSALTFLITSFSRSYLHREGGFKRFFNTVMFFYFGYNVLVLAGNLASFFVGWEISGIASFLLIGFYRSRYMPIKNAVKIFSVYRLADIAFILAAWFSHLIWHRNVAIVEFENTPLVLNSIQHALLPSVGFCVAVFSAAAIKSGQFPFSSWVPRAMEGPTPSSAIFYTSLSIHAGLLLILRTKDFWLSVPYMQTLLIVMGLVTFIVSTFNSMVQTNIKGQIAYSSVAQIGIMFVEVALGFNYLAIIHFAGNAFYRSYQLLVSPSIITYKTRESFFISKRETKSILVNVFPKLSNTIYVLSLKEWYMDDIMHHSIWNILKRLGRKLLFLNHQASIYILCISVIVCFIANYLRFMTGEVLFVLPVLIFVFSSILALRSFVEKKSVLLTWRLIFYSQVLVSIALSINTAISLNYSMLYLSGILLAGFIGYFYLKKLIHLTKIDDITWYKGLSYEHPKLNVIILFCTLALYGFPVSPTFVGVEVLFTHLYTNDWLLAVAFLFVLLVNSLSLMRLYSRVFLGPHIVKNHESANLFS